MNKKFAAFDLEIATELPENTKDWRDFSPLGISCAAVAFNDKDEVEFWQGVPRMSQEASALLVDDLQTIAKDYTIITWNGYYCCYVNNLCFETGRIR